jgi:hypothetical protein
MKMIEYESDMPLELRLDLLVDGELGEHQRAELLRLLDREPERWRELAVRFLQQQTEKQSVRKLMAGGNVVPEQALPKKGRVIGHVGMRRFTATAAGLLIAAGSVLLTMVVMRTPAQAEELHTTLPVEATALELPVPVTVPLVRTASEPQYIPAAQNRSTRNSVVLQSDGNGGAIVIPVSTVKAPIY